MITTENCCLCQNPTTYLTRHSAFIVAKGQEVRVYYHEACFNVVPNSKEIITKTLNEMSKNV